jgi:glycosyltransferase involved in cell wall biosynthesis
MKIAIFSKFNMAGGSEFRCVELCNGISKFTEHEAFLLSEKNLPQKLFQHIDKDVNVIENCFLTPEYFYQSDVIIVINTDSRDFSTLDYWAGKSPSHNFSLNIEKLKDKKMFFLYNFIVSPSRHLNQLKDAGIDVGILTTNHKFFDEITKQDRYEHVRTLPRYILTSPIDPDKLNIFERTSKDKIYFGMHSKRLGNKWNDEIEKLIKDINQRYSKDQVRFRFMGIKGDLKRKIEKIPNVTCLNEDGESVNEFLSKLDVFLFFPDWKREEPWGRVIAEAMVSGCPVIALDKGGTKDQVLKYNNGFLCKRYNDYYQHVIHFLEHREDISIMSKNSIRISKDFHTERVIGRLISIIEGV